MRVKTIIFHGFAVFLFLSSNLTGDENSLTTEKQRLVILPSRTETNESFDIEKEMTKIVTNIATDLKRFEIIDRNNLEQIMEEQKLHLSGIIDNELLVEIGKIAASNEGLVVSVLNFHQKGVPPEESDEDDDDEVDDDDDLSFGERLTLAVVKGVVEVATRSKEDDEPFPNNIQTVLSVEVSKINLETGKVLDSFTIDTQHTGGTKGVSRSKVVKKFRRQANIKMKELYTLSSEIISVKGSTAMLLLGKNMGVEEGIFFEIYEPDKIRTIRGKLFTVSGDRNGIVQVRKVSPETNETAIVRKWGKVKEGYKALEFLNTVWEIDLSYTMNADQKYSGGQVNILYNPLNTFHFGGSIRVGYGEDSRKEQDMILGFGAIGGMNIFQLPLISLTAQLGLNVDLAFRADDDDPKNTVNTVLPSFVPSLKGKITLSRKIDLTVTGGYIVSEAADEWTYTTTEDDESETHDAVWENDAPELDISGPFLSISIGYFIL